MVLILQCVHVCMHWKTQNGHIFAISSKYQWAVGLWVIAVLIFGAFLYVPHFLQPPHVGNGTWMFSRLWRWLVIIREALLWMLESKFIEELLLKVAPVPVCCCPERLPTWDAAPTCPFSFISLPCFVRTSHMLFLLLPFFLTGRALQPDADLCYQLHALVWVSLIWWWVKMQSQFFWQISVVLAPQWQLSVFGQWLSVSVYVAQPVTISVQGKCWEVMPNILSHLYFIPVIS